MGKTFNVVAAKLLFTLQAIKDIQTKANTLANQTQSDVIESLKLITSAASAASNNSQECFEKQASMKARIINQTNQEIFTTLSSLDQLKTIENELITIKLSFKNYNVNVKINQLLKCKENIIVSSVNIVNIINCYREIPRNFSDYIMSLNTTLNGLYETVTDVDSHINLLQEFKNIEINAVLNARNIFICEIDTINSKANKLMELINTITLKNNTILMILDAALDEYLSTVVSLFNSTLNLLPTNTGDLSRDKLVLPGVKAEILKNITAAIRYIVDRNDTEYITNLASAVIKRLNEKVTDKYVIENCQHFARHEQYTICVKDIISELNRDVNNADMFFNSSYNQYFQLNISFTEGITSNLKTSLSNIYNSTILQAVNTFTESLWSGLSAANIELGNTYNDREYKLAIYKITTSNLISSTIYNKILLAARFPEYLNLWIDYWNFVKHLDAVQSDINQQILNTSFNIDTRNIISIDASNIDSVLKNCASQQNNFEQAVNICIKPIVTDFNKELKVNIFSLNNYSEKSVNFVEQLYKDLDQLVNTFIFKSYQKIKINTNYEIYLAIVESYEKNVLNENLNMTMNQNKILEDLRKVERSARDIMKDAQNHIDKAIGTLNSSIEVALYYKSGRNLTHEKSILEKLKIDARSITNLTIFNIIGQYKGNITDLRQQYDILYSEQRRKEEEVYSSQINKKCKYQAGNETLFFICVENIFKDYNNNLKNLTQKFKDLNNTMSNFRLSFDATINSNVIHDLKPIKNMSDIVSNEIYSKLNIPYNKVLTTALTEIKKYNITNIRETIKQLIWNAELIKKYTLDIMNSETNKLFKAGSAIYDIVGIGRVFCDTTTITKMVSETAAVISTATKTVLAQSPDTSPVRNRLLKLAKFINSTLNYQLSLLDEDRLNVICPPSLADSTNFQNLHNCFVMQINNFSSYYNSQTELLKSYERNSLEDSERILGIIYKWATDVNQQITPIKAKAEKEAANFYQQCNITIDKIINFSIDVSRSHYHTFQTILLSNLTAINNLIDVIAGKINSIPNIDSRLQSAATFVYTAVTAVLNSKNISLNYETIKHASETLIANNIVEYNKFVGNLSIQSNKYKKLVGDLLQYRDDKHKTYDYRLLADTCSTDVQLINWYLVSNVQVAYERMVSLSACTNNLVYRYIFKDGNINILDDLLAIKQKLQSFVKLFDDYTNEVILRQKWSSYNLVKQIYGQAWTGIPHGIFN